MPLKPASSETPASESATPCVVNPELIGTLRVYRDLLVQDDAQKVEKAVKWVDGMSVDELSRMIDNVQYGHFARLNPSERECMSAFALHGLLKILEATCRDAEKTKTKN